MTTTQTTETPLHDQMEPFRHRVSAAMDSLGDVATDEAVTDGRWNAAFAAVWREIDALVTASVDPKAVDSVRALEFVKRIQRFAADADAVDAVSAATALTYIERNAEALAALLAASASAGALRTAAARLVACLDAITFSEGPEYAAADAPDRFRVVQIRPLKTWRQSVEALADLRALLASPPPPVLEPEHEGDRDPDARVKKGFRIGVNAAAKLVESIDGPGTRDDPADAYSFGGIADRIRELAAPEDRQEAGYTPGLCPKCDWFNNLEIRKRCRNCGHDLTAVPSPSSTGSQEGGHE